MAGNASITVSKRLGDAVEVEVEFTSIRVKLDDMEFDLDLSSSGGALRAKIHPLSPDVAYMSLKLSSKEILRALHHSHPVPPHFDTLDEANAWLDRYPVTS